MVGLEVVVSFLSFMSSHFLLLSRLFFLIISSYRSLCRICRINSFVGVAQQWSWADVGCGRFWFQAGLGERMSCSSSVNVSSWVNLTLGLVLELPSSWLVSLLFVFGVGSVACSDRSAWCRRVFSTGCRPSWFIFHFKFLRSCGVSAPCPCLTTSQLIESPWSNVGRADDLGEDALDETIVLYHQVSDSLWKSLSSCFLLGNYYSMLFLFRFYIVVLKYGFESHITVM